MVRRFVRFVYLGLVNPVVVRTVHPIRRRRAGILSEQAKGETVVSYAEGVPTLVETGTYHGATVAACLGRFKRIYTIELDQALYDAARERFAVDTSVTVINGDSATELGRLATSVTGPIVFWLDAHYSYGETAKGPHDPPLPWELQAILGRGEKDVILIDDARHMGVLPDYPSVDEIRRIVGDRALSFDVAHDIIRITLKSTDSAGQMHPAPPAESHG